LGDDQHFPGRRDFLTKFQRIVDRSHFCDKTSGRFARKPCQNVHKMTTTAMLELHEVCVLNGPLKYLLTSKTLTSYIENLFSQLREGGVQNPNASRTRLMLRLISVGQFLHVNRYSSYEVDPEVHAVDFLKVPSKRVCPVAEREENELERDLHEDMADMVFADISDVNLNFVDECGVYYMAGWAVSKIKLNCDTCADAVRSPVPLEIAPAEWTEKMSWGGLGHPTAIVFNVLCTLEKIITSWGSDVVKMKNPVKAMYLNVHNEAPEDVLEAFPICHPILGDIVEKFARLRLYVATRDYSSEIPRTICYASKSAYKETASTNVGRARQ